MNRKSLRWLARSSGEADNPSPATFQLEHGLITHMRYTMPSMLAIRQSSKFTSRICELSRFHLCSLPPKGVSLLFASPE
jgi:hypothetical protein